MWALVIDFGVGGFQIDATDTQAGNIPPGLSRPPSRASYLGPGGADEPIDLTAEHAAGKVHLAKLVRAYADTVQRIPARASHPMSNMRRMWKRP
jgi:hypothetical protein